MPARVRPRKEVHSIRYTLYSTSVYLSYRFPVQLGDKCAEGVSNGEQSGSAVLHQASNNINMSPSCRKWSGERESVCVCVCMCELRKLVQVSPCIPSSSIVDAVMDQRWWFQWAQSSSCNRSCTS